MCAVMINATAGTTNTKAEYGNLINWLSVNSNIPAENGTKVPQW